MIDPTTLFSALQNLTPALLAKVFLLVVLLLLSGFTFVVLIQVQSLNKLITIVNAHASLIVFLIALLQFLFAVSLFIAVLAIL